MGNKVRLRTKSKIWYDDEIDFIVDGDVHLKPGVHRKHYGDWIDPEDMEGHINMTEYKVRKSLERLQELDIINITEEEYE